MSNDQSGNGVEQEPTRNLELTRHQADLLWLACGALIQDTPLFDPKYVPEVRELQDELEDVKHDISREKRGDP